MTANADLARHQAIYSSFITFVKFGSGAIVVLLLVLRAWLIGH